MRILWLTVDRSSHIPRIFDPLREAFVLLEPDTKIIAHSRWNRDSISNDGHPYEPVLDPSWINEFDLVFTDAIFAYMKTEWNKIYIPKCVLFEDVHGPVVKNCMNKTRREFGFNFFFIRYRDTSIRMHEWLLRESTYWLPHSIDTSIFYSTGFTNRPIRTLLTGQRLDMVYPDRDDADSQLHNMPGFLCIPRPKEGVEDPWPIRSDYAGLLRASRICIGDGSKYEYPTLKHFEIPACGSVLLMYHFKEMNDLGFDGMFTSVDMYNYKSWKHAVIELLSNEERMADISCAGYNVVQLHHTADIRALELKGVFEKILGPSSAHHLLQEISDGTSYLCHQNNVPTKRIEETSSFNSQ